jgi:hypothetical protein
MRVFSLEVHYFVRLTFQPCSCKRIAVLKPITPQPATAAFINRKI